MANVCSCYMRVEGCKSELKELQKLIERQKPEFLDMFWFFTEESAGGYGLFDFENWDDYLSISIAVKWDPPLSEFNNLSTLFPGLTFTVNYEEPGCNIFGVATIRNGAVLEEKKDPYDYYSEFAEFQNAIGEIEDLPYDEYLKKYVEPGDIVDVEIDCPAAEYLERHIVERIKEEDLPLLINYEWGNEGGKHYKQRLKKGERNGMDNNISTV